MKNLTNKTFLKSFFLILITFSVSSCATLFGNSEDRDLKREAAEAQCEEGTEPVEQGAVYAVGVNDNYSTVNIYLRPEVSSRPIPVAKEVVMGGEFGPRRVHGIPPSSSVYLVVDPVGGNAVQWPFSISADVGRGTLLDIQIGIDGTTRFIHSSVKTYGVDCIEK